MFTPMFSRRDPFDNFRNELEQVLTGWLGQPSSATNRALRRNFAAPFPALNVSETDDAYHLEAELPGISRDDLDISVVGDELTIRGTRKERAPENAASRQREINYGTFARKIQFRTDLDAEAVEATFKDGVLTLRLPKAASARPRKITIQAH